MRIIESRAYAAERPPYQRTSAWITLMVRGSRGGEFYEEPPPPIDPARTTRLMDES